MDVKDGADLPPAFDLCMHLIHGGERSQFHLFGD